MTPIQHLRLFCLTVISVIGFAGILGQARRTPASAPGIRLPRLTPLTPTPLERLSFASDESSGDPIADGGEYFIEVRHLVHTSSQSIFDGV